MIAHAGGWDELLIAVGAVLVVVVPRMISERRRRRREQTEAPGACLNCDAELPAEAERCPACGSPT